MAKNLLVVMVGLPCSGKSTEVEYTANVFNAVVVSTDAYIEAKAKQMRTTYSAIWESTIKEAELAMNARILEAVAEGKNIIIDQTNLGVAKRKRVCGMVPHYYEKIAYVFNTPWETILERLEERNKTGKVIPVELILDMKKRYKEPTKSEGFSEIIFKHVQRGR